MALRAEVAGAGVADGRAALLPLASEEALDGLAAAERVGAVELAKTACLPSRTTPAVRPAMRAGMAARVDGIGAVARGAGAAARGACALRVWRTAPLVVADALCVGAADVVAGA